MYHRSGLHTTAAILVQRKRVNQIWHLHLKLQTERNILTAHVVNNKRLADARTAHFR